MFQKFLQRALPWGPSSNLIAHYQSFKAVWGSSDKPGCCWLCRGIRPLSVFAHRDYLPLLRFPCKLSQNLACRTRTETVSAWNASVEDLFILSTSFYLLSITSLSDIRKDKEIIPALRDSGESRRKTAWRPKAQGSVGNQGWKHFPLASRWASWAGISACQHACLHTFQPSLRPTGLEERPGDFTFQLVFQHNAAGITVLRFTLYVGCTCWVLLIFRCRTLEKESECSCFSLI